MTWTHPTAALLEEVVGASSGRVTIASPFVSRRTLEIVADSLPPAVGSLEMWTRLSMRDWMTGSSDHEALADFVEDVTRVRPISLLTGDLLHAKFVVSGSALALAGSSNLTNGGYFRNLELVRRIEGEEVDQIRQYAAAERPRLTVTSRNQLDEFLAACLARGRDRAPLLELIAEFSGVPPGAPLMTVDALDNYCRTNPAFLTNTMLAISTGTDRNNRTGHAHQAFFTVQRFLQEHAEYVPPVAAASLETEFEIAAIPGLLAAWTGFMDAHITEASDAPFRYAFSSMKRNLPPSGGGTLDGGGGWIAPFRRVWPIVARMMS